MKGLDTRPFIGILSSRITPGQRNNFALFPFDLFSPTSGKIVSSLTGESVHHDQKITAVKDL